MSRGTRNKALLAAIAMAVALSPCAVALQAGPGTSPANPIEEVIAQAENNLREGDRTAAEAHYQEALQQGRLLLALLELQAGSAKQAVQLLEEARAAGPQDLEVAFALGNAYLGLAKPELAASAFAPIIEARPIPQTHLLLARTYRDFREYERCRTQLRAALAQDPGASHAHFELGVTALQERGRTALDEAILEFQAELKLAPDDPHANLELGAALVETQRPAEALAPLQIASRVLPPEARLLAYLGRALTGSGGPAEGAAALQQSLELAEQQGANAAALRAIHLHLARALRDSGDAENAATHFAEAQRLSVQGTESDRESLARYLAEAPVAAATQAVVARHIAWSSIAELSSAERVELRRRVVTALCRSYLNLGILQAQQERFEPAAELFAKAAALDPDFPQIQSSLGIAYFNARQFDKATQPLQRALLATPNDFGLSRMLALAWLNTQAYAKAVELLQDDPQRDIDASLQFAYGLALVKSDRAPEAERVFAKLLARHGDSAELSVFLGQAYAQQGNFEAAIASLEHALALKPDVAEGNATLGLIYLKQGRLPEAISQLEAALRLTPDDASIERQLAQAHEQTGRQKGAKKP